MIYIYSRDSCSPCTVLKRWLDGLGEKYQVLDVDAPEHLRKLLELTNQLVVPTTVVGDRVIQGLNIGLVKQALAEMNSTQTVEG